AGPASFRPAPPAWSAGRLRQRGIARGKLPREMAVILWAHRFAQRGEDGCGSGAGLVFGQPGALGHLPDELGDLDRMCAVPAAARSPQLLGRCLGKIQGEALGLTFAQLAGESTENG